MTVGCWLITSYCFSQKPVGKFLADSVEIGKPINYGLSYRHSASEEVFFPDTTYNFYPFELLKRTYLPTKTNKKGSLDSVIYTLQTFDISPVQLLSLPIYVLTQRDCTAVFSASDSIFLKEMIRGKSANMTLQSDTKLLTLEQQVDYPRVVGYLLGLMVIAGIIYVFLEILLINNTAFFCFNDAIGISLPIINV